MIDYQITNESEAGFQVLDQLSRPKRPIFSNNCGEYVVLAITAQGAFKIRATFSKLNDLELLTDRISQFYAFNSQFKISPTGQFAAVFHPVGSNMLTRNNLIVKKDLFQKIYNYIQMTEDQRGFNI